MAKAVKLTEATVSKARLEPGQKQDFLWDNVVTGLGLRVLAGGSRTFWYQYRMPGGTSRMVRIGPWPAVTLSDARKAARSFAGAVARGEDPAADRQEERRRADAALRQLLAEGGEYERHLKRRHIVNAKMVMSGLRRGLWRFMGKDIAAITRHDFVAAITAIEDQGKLGAAADLRKFSRTLCEWAVNRGLVTANVMAGLRKPKQTRAEKLAAEAGKARALHDAEIIAVWNACEGRGSFGNVVRLLLLSGARLGEIAKLRRNQILSDRLVLPPLSTKTGEKHEVPLTEMMRTVIAAQPATLSEFAFPSEKTGRPIAGWNRPVVALRQASGVDFTLHDLRRTCRTLMSHCRVEFEVAELAIGHKRTGLARLYDFSELWEARREAFAKVSDHVARLLDRSAAEGKVVAIPALA